MGVGLNAGDELVDIVDEFDHVVDSVPRRVMRAERLRHRAVFIAVVDGMGRLLVHRRSPAKDVWPGWCDIAVGGVVGAGETYLEAAHRELAEEIGVTTETLAELDLGESRPYDDDQVSLLARCYLVTSEGPFTFDDGEVVEAWWVHRDGLDDLLVREKFLPDSLALLLPHIDF
jgi:8-oxo-dGTP pyrophosphatase MutT (NUDIX family)